MSSTAPKKKVVSHDKKIAERWTKDLIAPGFTALPTVIVRRQQALGLDALDVNIILMIAGYWWDVGNLPRPSKRTIALSIGVDPRTVQRRIAKMQKAKFIKRVARGKGKFGNDPNEYDFSGLIKAATPFALEEMDDIANRKAIKEAKLKSKKPRLTLVK